MALFDDDPEALFGVQTSLSAPRRTLKDWTTSPLGGAANAADQTYLAGQVGADTEAKMAPKPRAARGGFAKARRARAARSGFGRRRITRFPTGR